MLLSEVMDLCLLPLPESVKIIEEKTNTQLEQIRQALDSYIAVSGLRTSLMTIDTFYNAHFLKKKIEEKTKKSNLQKEIIVKVVEEVLSKLM